MELDLSWVPRGQNEEADALTNERFEDFDMAKRIEVEFEKMKFVLLLDQLMSKAGELDEELKLHKTSREAKRSSYLKEKEDASVKRRKGEMKWKDPW